MASLLIWDHVEAAAKGPGATRHSSRGRAGCDSAQILASLADEQAWKARFAEKREVLGRMAREALEEDANGETLPLTDLL